MTYQKPQLFFLVTLRIFIGWHFLFEGLIKLFNPGWTAKGYLLSSQGIFSGLFIDLAESGLVGFTDGLTIGILIGVGTFLILGIREKYVAFAGMALLFLFYLSHPSWPGLQETGPVEGNYLIVNKNLIEIAALGVLAYFPTGAEFGLELILKRPARQLA